MSNSNFTGPWYGPHRDGVLHTGEAPSDPMPTDGESVLPDPPPEQVINPENESSSPSPFAYHYTVYVARICSSAHPLFSGTSTSRGKVLEAEIRRRLARSPDFDRLGAYLATQPQLCQVKILVVYVTPDQREMTGLMRGSFEFSLPIVPTSAASVETSDSTFETYYQNDTTALKAVENAIKLSVECQKPYSIVCNSEDERRSAFWLICSKARIDPRNFEDANDERDFVRHTNTIDGERWMVRAVTSDHSTLRTYHQNGQTVADAIKNAIEMSSKHDIRVNLECDTVNDRAQAHTTLADLAEGYLDSYGFYSGVADDDRKWMIRLLSGARC